MVSINEIKVGKKIVLESDPYVVLFAQHSKMGRAGAVLRTKLKNLKTGTILNKTFQGADKIEAAEVEKRTIQYLYGDAEFFHFMNIENYEQLDFSKKAIGDCHKFLIEEAEVEAIYFNDQPINIELPIKMAFKVIDAPPSIRGNTANGGTKQVTIETGVTINTPLFIETGDTIRINTETAEYVERVKK
jgi:elongation factor P